MEDDDEQLEVIKVSILFLLVMLSQAKNGFDYFCLFRDLLVIVMTQPTTMNRTLVPLHYQIAC